jgi:hypothetical protein
MDAFIMAQPLDLVACKGNDIVSNTIMKGESFFEGRGIVSHVGLVVTSDILPKVTIEDIDYHLDPNKKYIFQSAVLKKGLTDPVPETNTGVQIRELEEYVANYKKEEGTSITLYSLKNNPWYDKNKRQNLIGHFTNIFEKYQGRQYAFDILLLLGASYKKVRWLRNLRDNMSYYLFGDKTGPYTWMFCSELVATVYNELGIISCSNPENFSPERLIECDIFSLRKEF